MDFYAGITELQVEDYELYSNWLYLKKTKIHEC